MENELFDISRSEWERLIDEHIIGRNAERNRKVLKMKLLDGVTYEKTAEFFDMSDRQMRAIVRDCLNKLSTKIR